MPDPSTDQRPSPREGLDSTQTSPRSWRPLPWVAAALLLISLTVLLVNPGLVSHLGQRISGSSRVASVESPQAPDASQRLADLEQRVAQLEQASAQKSAHGAAGDASQVAAAAPSPLVPAIVGRVAALESQAVNLTAADTSLTSRLEALSQEVQRISGNVQASDMQIRELFLLSVMRRSVQAGRNVSPLVDLLQRTYQTQFPAAVDALATWSARPQSRTDLGARLESLIQSGAEPKGQGSWWDRLRARVSQFIAAGSSSGRKADEGLQSMARAALENGDLAGAIALVEKFPVDAVRDTWLDDARRLLAAEQALDMLEDSAIGRTIDTLAATPPPTAAPLEAPVNAPPVNAPPVNAPPVNAPPVNAPPVNAPEVLTPQNG